MLHWIYSREQDESRWQTKSTYPAEFDSCFRRFGLVSEVISRHLLFEEAPSAILYVSERPAGMGDVFCYRDWTLLSRMKAFQAWLAHSQCRVQRDRDAKINQLRLRSEACSSQSKYSRSFNNAMWPSKFSIFSFRVVYIACCSSFISDMNSLGSMLSHFVAINVMALVDDASRLINFLAIHIVW